MASQCTVVGHGGYGSVEKISETEEKDVMWSRDKLQAGTFDMWTEVFGFWVWGWMKVPVYEE